MIAAAHGLRPDQYRAMSERDFELYCQGYAKRIYQARELLAEVQANLINIHIPRGKGKVKPEDIFRRPKDEFELRLEEEQYAQQLIEMELEIEVQRQDDETDAEFIARHNAAREAKEREMDLEAREAQWWSSPLGKAMEKILGGDE